MMTTDAASCRTGASKVVPISHLIRNQTIHNAVEEARAVDERSVIKVSAPATYVHVGMYHLFRPYSVPSNSVHAVCRLQLIDAFMYGQQISHTTVRWTS
jgi:hypothetical protein